jgi:manganese transport protein
LRTVARTGRPRLGYCEAADLLANRSSVVNNSTDRPREVDLKNRIGIRVAKVLAAVGPGLFLIGYNIGTGSVTTMAKSGATHGMTLFWALFLSCVFTFVLLVAYGRMTLVTGKTALHNFKTLIRFGKPLALYIMAALIVGELLALMGIMGIVSDLLQEASRIFWGGSGIGTLWISICLVAGLYLLLWHGRYQTFEKLLTVFVILMGLCFILVFILVQPSLSVILAGMVPRIPREPGAFGLVAAMAGTTCSAAVFVIRSIVVAEKGWGLGELRRERTDAFVSAGTMLLLSGVIMAVSAGTLHVMGLRLENTVEMIHLFEPIGGTLAALVLIAGISAAGISTVFPIILIAPWIICDYTNRPRDIHSPLFRVLGLAGILFGLGSQFLEQRPPALMIFSQAFQACILPAVVVPIIILLNRRDIMGPHTARPILNLGLAAVFLFSLVTTYFAVAELLS